MLLWISIITKLLLQIEKYMNVYKEMEVTYIVYGYCPWEKSSHFYMLSICVCYIYSSNCTNTSPVFMYAITI